MTGAHEYNLTYELLKVGVALAEEEILAELLELIATFLREPAGVSNEAN